MEQIFNHLKNPDWLFTNVLTPFLVSVIAFLIIKYLPPMLNKLRFYIGRKLVPYSDKMEAYIAKTKNNDKHRIQVMIESPYSYQIILIQHSRNIVLQSALFIIAILMAIAVYIIGIHTKQSPALCFFSISFYLASFLLKVYNATVEGEILKVANDDWLKSQNKKLGQVTIQPKKPDAQE